MHPVILDARAVPHHQFLFGITRTVWLVIKASEPSWTVPFTGLSPRQFGELVTVLRHEGSDAPSARAGRGAFRWRTGHAGRGVLAH
ncbi:hypothetical protein GCM10023088_07570 [Actinomadura verrucosospora]